MGPLAGIKIVEMAGIGPGPMCAMLLADLGATIIRIDRVEPAQLGLPKPPGTNLVLRGRPTVRLDLKSRAGIAHALDLVRSADALIEGFRPGVMERLGLGPDACHAVNTRLVYGRMTGWGQTGPLAMSAGHDLNYIAISGVLHAIGRRGQPPTPPMNLVGDYGGGALFLALGIACALIESRSSGKGQVIDAAIVDGAAMLMMPFFGQRKAGLFTDRRGENYLDSGAYFYDVYECADGRWISVAPIEGKFHAELLRRLDIDPETMSEQMDRSGWETARRILTERFKQRTSIQWCELLEGTDACVAPVVDIAHAPLHPHLAARGTFIDVDGVVQPGPVPRFSRTVPDRPESASRPDLSIEQAMAYWGAPVTGRTSPVLR